ncbi:MAG: hypothetical protein ACQET1_03695, partial [Gemmatimonadota bacterium]
EQREALKDRLSREEGVRRWFQEKSLTPEAANPVLKRAGSGAIPQAARARELLKRPGVRAVELLAAGGAQLSQGQMDDAVTAVEVEVKYEGYVGREKERAVQLQAQAAFVLEDELPYKDFITLSFEAREKLDRIRPGSLAQAGRIPGVSPADLQNLMMEVRRWRSRGRPSA